MILETGYHAHAARVNDATLAGMEAMRPYFRAHLMPHLLDRDASILDLGCGYGKTLHALHKEGYRRLSGVDSNPEQAAAARALGFQADCADARDFLAGRSYDAVLMFDVLEHVPKAEAVDLLGSVRSALVPGGRLILQVPNGLAPLSPYRYEDFTHETAFTTSSLRQVLEAAGFAEVSFFELAPHVHGPASLVRRLAWTLVVRPLVAAYLAVSVGQGLGGVYTPNLLAVAERGRS